VICIFCKLEPVFLRKIWLSSIGSGNICLLCRTTILTDRVSDLFRTTSGSGCCGIAHRPPTPESGKHNLMRPVIDIQVCPSPPPPPRSFSRFLTRICAVGPDVD